MCKYIYIYVLNMIIYHSKENNILQESQALLFRITIAD